MLEVSKREQVIVTPGSPGQMVVVDRPQRVVAYIGGSRGPRGERGFTGPAGGTASVRTSAAAMSALLIVWEDQDGLVYPLDYRDAEHIDLLCGLTVTAAYDAGQEVEVRHAGPVDITGLSLAVGRAYLGANGQITSTPPDDGFFVVVGHVVSPGRIYLSFTDNFFLDEE